MSPSSSLPIPTSIISNSNSSRLLSTAKYDIQPQTLAACSSFPVAAISSRNSIVIFNIQVPFEPQLIFHYSSSYSRDANFIPKNAAQTHLCFHSESSISRYPRYLAASHDSSILIYDTTGATLNPLLVRMTMPYQYKKEPIRCLKWYDDHTLLSCSSAFIAKWDIREYIRTTNRPSSLIHGKGSWVSLAFGDNSLKTHQIAALGLDGMVSILDERKTLSTSEMSHSAVESSSATSTASLHQFKAHEVGIGIENFGDDWITWGQNNEHDTVVNIWKEEKLRTEQYWFVGMANTTASSEVEDTNENHPDTYKEHGNNAIPTFSCCLEQKIENLTTVRVLPDSSEGFLTLSSPLKDISGNIAPRSMFQTDLWKVDSTSRSGQGSSSQLSIDLLASFQSGGKDDHALRQMVGSDYLDGTLIGAEISRDQESLILCGLNDRGYFTSHSIPEASSLLRSQVKQEDQLENRRDSPFVLPIFSGINDNLKVYPGEEKTDSVVETYQQNVDGIRIKTPTFGDPLYFFQGNETTGMQFDMDEENHNIYEPIMPIVPGTTATAVPGQNKDVENEVDEVLPIAEEIDMTKAARIPSPRLCGATFGVRGGLLTFSNGDVKNMWSWYTSGLTNAMVNKFENRLSFGMLNKSEPMNELEDDMKRSKYALDSKGTSKHEFPRSFLDLLNVTKAAKVAQWGHAGDDDDDDDDQSASNDEGLTDSSNDLEDSSAGDSSSSSDFDHFTDDVDDSKVHSNADALYNSYFGGQKESRNGKDYEEELLGSGHEESQDAENEDESARVIGRPRGESMNIGQVVENLVRKVYFTNAYDELMLQGQCPELADKWKFGAWDDDTILQSTHESKVSEDQYFHPAIIEEANVLDKQEKNPRIEILSAKIPSEVTRKRLSKVSDICQHNAQCALEIGQREKADVWNVIVEIVDNHASCAYDDFDRWFNADGSALTSVLLRNILDFYEKRGDFQMLATIVTVLSAARNASGGESSWVGNILPPDDARFDMYIHTYSTLLYSWGKLSSRAELNKHLSSSRKLQRTKNLDHDMLPFSPWCYKCNLKVNPGTNICKNCQSYAFKCSVCTNSIRGLYTFCPICFHGGHANHMFSWFHENTMCPTGCGCNCILTGVVENIQKDISDNFVS